MLLVFNPLKSRFTDGTVKTEPGTDALYTFNRLWLDHCLTTGSVDHFQLEDLELQTGLLFEFQGLTLNGLSALSMEMNCSTLFGYHCRGLCGHVVLTVSQGVMIGMTVKEMTHRMQLGLDATADYTEGTEHTARAITVHKTADEEEMETATVDVTLGSLPLGHRVTVELHKRLN